MEHKDPGLMSTEIRVILLDLGGVLLELRDPFDTFDLRGDRHEFLERWLLSSAVRRLECGKIGADEFAAAAVEEFELAYDDKEFMRRFRHWPRGLFDGIPKLLGSLGKRYTIALLSNTNSIHWNRDDIAGVLSPLLDHTFLSYKTGLLKPEAPAFEYVLQRCDANGDDILFLDDNPLNVEAAQTSGMRALVTLGIEDLRTNLAANGIL